MNPAKPPKAPSYRRHKSSGQAVVTLNGHDCYLGPYGTDASIREYNRLVAEWQANGGRLPSQGPGLEPLTVAMLIDRYWSDHVLGYYRKAGVPTSEQALVRLSMRPLNRLYGDISAAEFSPLKLEAVRQEFISAGWSRKTVNDGVARIRLMFKWAVAKELLPATVHQALLAVRTLAKGRSTVKESEPVRPVPEAFIAATKEHVGRQVRAMIDLQLLTGMRPGEAVIMRTGDLEDTTAKVWSYRPGRHKTEHHDKDRVVYIGPQAQKILKPFLKPDLAAFIFNPAEALAERHARQAGERKTPLQPSQRARHERAVQRAARGKRRRAPKDRYTVNSYRRAIERACDEAFPPPAPLAKADGETLAGWTARLTATQKVELADWRRQHRWHPHQLRHNAATALRRQHGIEIARIILGHSSSAVTEVYAEMDRETAARVIAQVG